MTFHSNFRTAESLIHELIGKASEYLGKLMIDDNDDDDVQWFYVRKLTGSQLSLAHNAKVKTDMPENNENSWIPVLQSVR